MRARPTRRAVLVAGLVGMSGVGGMAALTSCTSDGPSGGHRTTPGQPPGPDADTVVRRQVITDKRETVRLYDAAAAVHAGLAARLAPYVADHVAHLAALGAPAATTASPGGPTTPAATAGASTTPSPSVPPQLDDAIALLVQRERAASDRRISKLGAVSGELARLIGSIGACEAVHAILLPTVLEGAPG